MVTTVVKQVETRVVRIPERIVDIHVARWPEEALTDVETDADVYLVNLTDREIKVDFRATLVSAPRDGHVDVLVPGLGWRRLPVGIDNISIKSRGSFKVVDAVKFHLPPGINEAKYVIRLVAVPRAWGPWPVQPTSVTVTAAVTRAETGREEEVEADLDTALATLFSGLGLLGIVLTVKKT